MALTSAQITSLKNVRANYVSKLETESANPRPSYSVGNQTVDFPAWAKWILDEIDRLDLMIQQQEDGRGAWEVRSRGLA